MTPSRFDAAVLSSERLLLRPVEARDARALFALYSDRDIMRFWSHEAWTMLEQAEAAIGAARLESANGESLQYVIVQRSSHTVIGSCALYGIARGEEHSALLGYLLSQEEWGKGYLTEAMRRFLGHAFRALDFDCIRAQVHPDNTASASLLAKLGFLPEHWEGEAWTVAGKICHPRAFRLPRTGLRVTVS